MSAGDPYDYASRFRCNCCQNAGTYSTTYTTYAPVADNSPKVVSAFYSAAGIHLVFDDGAVVCVAGSALKVLVMPGQARQAVNDYKEKNDPKSN